MTKHRHKWNLAKLYTSPKVQLGQYTDNMAVFVCECGAKKHVELHLVQNRGTKR